MRRHLRRALPAYSTMKVPRGMGCAARTPQPFVSVKNTSMPGWSSCQKGRLLQRSPQGQVRGSQWIKDSLHRGGQREPGLD